MSWGVVIIVGMVHSITFSFPNLNNRTKKGMFSEKKYRHPSLVDHCQNNVLKWIWDWKNCTFQLPMSSLGQVFGTY